MKIYNYNFDTNNEETRNMTAAELAEYEIFVNELALKKTEAKKIKDEAESNLLASLNITRGQAIVLGLIQPDYIAPQRDA